MNKYFISGIIILSTVLSHSCFAQVRDSLIQLTPEIGDTISIAERNYYELYPNIQGFQSAIVYFRNDTIAVSRITYLDENGTQKDSTLTNRGYYIESLRTHIRQVENENLANSNSDTEIIVFPKNGKEISGNLLAVRQSSILLYNHDCNDEEIGINCVNKFNGWDIQKVIIPGKSNVVLGVGIGLLIGTAVVVTGIIIADQPSDMPAINQEWSSTFNFIGVAIAAAGTIIGIVTSTPDKTIEPFSEDDIKGLSVYSRYSYGEPDELKKIK